MITLLTTGFTIPYNPFDMEKITPFFDDMVDKIQLGSTFGLMGFITITGLLFIVAAIRGLFR